MITHRNSPSAVQQLLNGPDGFTARALLRRGLKVETRAKKNLSGGASGPKRIDKGRLRNSITTQLRQGSGGLVVRVGTNVKYAIWVHEGTGIYGARGRPIRPTSAQFLRFKPKGLNKYVFAKSVKGMKKNTFLTSALPAARLNQSLG